jgi:aminoglycoside phosphotransferase (APT) family kinase protein
MREGHSMAGSGRLSIDVPLVRNLVARQFPQWADLPIQAVKWNGWDNATFRLGDRIKVRLPSAERYVPQIEKEHRWLPKLAPYLPLPIPVPLATGVPGEGYPWPWSIYEWIDGDTASLEHIGNLPEFAVDIAEFLIALQRIDATDGPRAGQQNFSRGGPLSVYDRETRAAIKRLRDEIDVGGATSVWDAALSAEWRDRPVWVHGDVSVGNLLVRDGRLSAVIDFGSCAIGDPACDLVITWTFLRGQSREAFRAAISADDPTWARARGWALWKALITYANGGGAHPAEISARRIIEEIVAEHGQAA